MSNNKSFGQTYGHCFIVDVPKSKTGDVRIIEDYGDLAVIEGDSLVVRALIDRKRWDTIREHVKADFNVRLRDAGHATGVWDTNGQTRLERLLGKELVLLAWGTEDIPQERWSQCVKNWAGMQPEERWWLHNAAAAATGHPVKHRGVGWRKAITIALSENPI